MMVMGLKQFGATVVFIATSFALAISGIIFVSPSIYRMAIDWFNLSDSSGLTKEQLVENYQVVMDYLIQPNVKELNMLHFSASEGGLQHFAEVKFLFMMLFMIALVGFVLSILLIMWLRHTKQQVWMGRWFWLAITFPLAILFIMVIAFDKVFLIFHQILFRNDLWLFSPITDPVITVLPEGLFMALFVGAILLYELIIYLIRFAVMYKKKPKRRVRR